MSQLTDINARDIRAAVELACETMQRVFNADDGDTPFFLAFASPKARLEFDAQFAEAHVPGRHLNALLRAEEAFGIEVDEGAIEKHARVLFRSLSRSVALPVSRRGLDAEPTLFLPHNVREVAWGLWALARYRGSDEAVTRARSLIAAVNEFWSPEDGWAADRLRSEHGVECEEDQTSVMWGIGRAIGPLTALYKETGFEPAGELAHRVVARAIEEGLPEDGAWAVERTPTHIHSITCTLSGIAEFAEATGDASALERARAFYHNGLAAMSDQLSWAIEGLHHDRGGVPDMGEANSTGDIIETALVLGRAGDHTAFGDAELAVRGHLLPSQLRDTSFFDEQPNPDGIDGLRDVAARLRGAWGFPAPYGHRPFGIEPIMFHLDVVGGTSSSLCKVYQNIIRREADGTRQVNMLFDGSAYGLSVTSPYTDEAIGSGNGVLEIEAIEPGDVRIRVPEWVPPGSVRVDGELRVAADGYLRICDPPVGKTIKVSFPLTERTIVLHHRLHDIRVRLRGDEVIAMESFGAELTYFPPWE